MVKRWLRHTLGVTLRRVYHLGQYYVEQDLPAFANQPRNLTIELPRRIFEPHCMFIGDDVKIGPASLLVAQTHYPTETMQHPTLPRPVVNYAPRIVIGNRVTSSGGLTISAMREVVIEDDVMLALNVMIMDGMHGFENANEPYKYQPMGRIAPTRIKRGCWIGQNAVILPGVTVGELSIVGANSVVTKDVPPRSIVIGTPARVVKRWSETEQRWRSVVPAAGASVPGD